MGHCLPALSCEACICNVFLTKLTLFVVTVISHGTSVLKRTRLNELMHWEMVTQNLSMDLSTQWPVFEISRYNKGLPLYDRVCMEYVDNNSYEVKSCPESQYNMWDCFFIQLFSYGKLPYDYDDQRATERNFSRASYEEVLEKSWA